jgi:hypothetical protein
MVDRTRTGWDVIALFTEAIDDRPLRIVGAATHDITSATADLVRTEVPHELLVASDLLCDDEAVQDWVLQVIGEDLTNVAVWGDGSTALVEGPERFVTHHLSRVARVYKAQALRAAVAPTTSIAPVESFRTAIVPSSASES